MTGGGGVFTHALVQELLKVSEQLKSSNDARLKLKMKLDDAVAGKTAAEESASSEQQRLTFALEETRAEMEVLKAIYQDELDAAKRAAADNTRAATSQVCYRFLVLFFLFYKGA